MDLFPVAVRGSPAIISCGRTAGGVRVQVLEFLQHSVCTGILYCVLIARTQGADLIQRGGIALRTATAAAAKAAAGGSEEAVEGEEGEVLEGGEGADDDDDEKAPPSPSAEDHDDGDSSLADIGYLIN